MDQDPWYTEKDNKIILIYKEIQMVSGAKPYCTYMRKGFLIYEEMRNCNYCNYLTYEENFLFFFISVGVPFQYHEPGLT
jgi:hypothetical protein